jgi:4-amino-4-deoxy-L-arabinose transferase-like glycosyltransferase
MQGNRLVDISHKDAAVPHQGVILISLVVAAFLIRIGVRMLFGEEYFWENSYHFYYELAEALESGRGFCVDTSYGTTICAPITPLYPLFLAATALVGKNYLLIVVPEALMGAGTALCAFLIGRHIFNSATGILACAITAFYPYYVMHDTALQDTGMATFGTALSVWLVLRASRLDSTRSWFLAGLTLGATVLVRASTVPAVGVTLLWTAVWGGQGNGWKRLQRCLILLLAVSVLVGPWLIRNYFVIGAPVLSSETGYMLWRGNNPETFSRYPAESMDRSAGEAWGNLTQADRTEFKSLAHDEIAASNWLAHRAFEFIRANPRLVLEGAVLKLEAAFSWRLNPHREFLAQAAYAIGYVPIAILGIVGMFLARRRDEVILIGMLFLAFMGITAVFFANTSQRTYLDVYWIVFAAYLLESARTRLARECWNEKQPVIQPSAVTSEDSG